MANALSPAKVDRVLVDEENNYATVIVPDDQLSLAIGKEGQNARLAARLTGWHIDIKSASFTGAPLPKTENMLIDEDDLEDEEELCAYVDENGVRCRNHARPEQLLLRHPQRPGRGIGVTYGNGNQHGQTTTQLHRLRRAGRQNGPAAHRTHP